MKTRIYLSIVAVIVVVAAAGGEVGCSAAGGWVGAVVGVGWEQAPSAKDAMSKTATKVDQNFLFMWSFSSNR